MASKFDNEMDFLLRQTARQNTVAPVNEETLHLDADDLAAFAENALPPLARPALILHLADCDLCRAGLSNLILLNEAAEEEETAISAAPEKNIVAAKSSWLGSLKKLFAVPTLGYATASLAVLLIGSFAFVALRGTQENRSASIAQVEPEQTEAQAKKRPSAPQPVELKEENEVNNIPEPSPTIDNANTVVADSSPSPNETPADLPPSVRITKGETSANRNAAPSETVVARNSSANTNSAGNTAASLAQPVAPVAGLAKPAPSEKNEIAPSTASKPASKTKEELPADRNNSRSDDQDELAGTEDKDSSERMKVAPSAVEGRAAAASAGGAGVTAKRRIAAETRVVGGRKFQKLGSVWQDAAYNSQNVKNVWRGSDDYKKLDAGLRSIAESLSGEIIVVWQDKAYRIR